MNMHSTEKTTDRQLLELATPEMAKALWRSTPTGDAVRREFNGGEKTFLFYIGALVELHGPPT